jgi:hypothetical protein
MVVVVVVVVVKGKGRGRWDEGVVGWLGRG